MLRILCAIVLFAGPQAQAPRIWDDARLAEWATPLATLNVRPAHFTSEEYYLVPSDNLRTYRVYPPDREPPGYWEWLQAQRPQPLVDAAQIHSNDDWVAARKRAFLELDAVLARTIPSRLGECTHLRMAASWIRAGSSPSRASCSQCLIAATATCVRGRAQIPCLRDRWHHGRRKCRSLGRQDCRCSNVSGARFPGCFSMSLLVWRSGERWLLRRRKRSASTSCAT